MLEIGMDGRALGLTFHFCRPLKAQSQAPVLFMIEFISGALIELEGFLLLDIRPIMLLPSMLQANMKGAG